MKLEQGTLLIAFAQAQKRAFATASWIRAVAARYPFAFVKGRASR
jgi:hypothetical protein